MTTGYNLKLEGRICILLYNLMKTFLGIVWQLESEPHTQYPTDQAGSRTKR